MKIDDSIAILLPRHFRIETVSNVLSRYKKKDTFSYIWYPFRKPKCAKCIRYTNDF